MKRNLLWLALTATVLHGSSVCGDRPYRDAALRAAEWIRASGIHTKKGLIWPADPRDSSSVMINLYSGSSGVVLFFNEAFRSTGDSSYLRDAGSGADYLLASIGTPDSLENLGPGLYTGVAGVGYALMETYKSTGIGRYRDGTRACAEYIRSKAEAVGKGSEWPMRAHDTTIWSTDIIGGSAGTGLFLLYAAQELGDSRYLDLAASAGLRLIEAGIPSATGTKWASDALEPKLTPVFRRLMPNFSHGTAGISYFLASLYMKTEKKEFLDAAIRGARYLQSIAKTDSGRALIFHDEPDNRELYYLGWCHGPAGTSRLFYRLYQITHDMEWLEWVDKSAQGDLHSGIPDRLTPGFWNNISRCCGSAGVAEFFLNLYRIEKKDEYLSFSKRMTSNLLSRATAEQGGLKWIQAENRVSPDVLVAQTGLMEGAAGVGIWLFALDAFENGTKGTIVLPDSPFQ